AEVSREALKVAEALDDDALRSRSLNTLGTALIDLGEVEHGSRHLREALALAEQTGIPWMQNAAYINLADSLHLAGRLREARAVVEEGLAEDLRLNQRWLVLLRAELAIEAGELDEAEATLAAFGGRALGNTLVNLDLRRAELALLRGDHAVARERLAEAAQLSVGMDEPPVTGVVGALRAELERPGGGLQI